MFKHLSTLMLLLALVLGGISSALAQCPTCRAGGHCAQNQGGVCLANRTFWGFKQGTWRKWPSVAAEEAAAANAPAEKLPGDDAPSSVPPKPADEARSTPAPAATATEPATKSPDSATAPKKNELPAPSEVPAVPKEGSTPAPAQPAETPPSKTPPEEKKLPFALPEPLEPAKKPEPKQVQPALPGALLDDPAPVPPVDPSDAVPSLPPNLRDMKQPVEAPTLDDLFEQNKTSTEPKLPGEASLPQSNQPAEIARTNAEGPRFADQVLRLSPAAANMPSAAEDSETSETAPAVQPADAAEQEALPAELNPPGEEEEPSLLLTPADGSVKNPLREVIHARYAARMFTPQARAAGAGSGEDEQAPMTNPLRQSVAQQPQPAPAAEPLVEQEPQTATPISTDVRSVLPTSAVLPTSFEQPVDKDSPSALAGIPSPLMSEVGPVTTAMETDASNRQLHRRPTLATEEQANRLRAGHAPMEVLSSNNPLRREESLASPKLPASSQRASQPAAQNPVSAELPPRSRNNPLR